MVTHHFTISVHVTSEAPIVNWDLNDVAGVLNRTLKGTEEQAMLDIDYVCEVPGGVSVSFGYPEFDHREEN